MHMLPAQSWRSFWVGSSRGASSRDAAEERSGGHWSVCGVKQCGCCGGKHGSGREQGMWGSPPTFRQTMYLRRGSVCRRSASSMPADVASMACPLASPVSARVAPMSLPKPTRPEQARQNMIANPNPGARHRRQLLDGH